MTDRRTESRRTEASTAEELVAALRAPGGGFAMLALDQRESLRRMFPLRDGAEVGDAVLRDFKRTAIELLSPHASAVLLDRLYAVDGVRPAELAPETALILAADVLEQPPGLPVETTSLDAEVTPELIGAVGAAAIKLLVIWRDDGREEERRDLVAEFIDVAERAGVASLVEGIVRPPVGDEWESPAERHRAIIAAAAELSTTGTSIYKAEVPGYVPGDVSRVEEHAARISELVPVPWVVLSNGVQQQDFADGLAAACRGGASGFLAGRAVWADTVAAADPRAALRERSVERLRALGHIVSAQNV
jgi:sulfofructosephosphate aldolase